MGVEYYKAKTSLWLLHNWWWVDYTDEPEEKETIRLELASRGYGF